MTAKKLNINASAIAYANSPNYLAEEIAKPTYAAPTLLAGIVPNGVEPAIATDNVSYAYANLMANQGGYGFSGYPALAALSTRSEYRAFADALSTEITRKWIRFSSDDDDGLAERVAELEKACERLKLRDHIRKLSSLDALFGRAQILPNLREHDNATPLILSAVTIKPKSLTSFAVIEPMWTTPAEYNSLDPAAVDFYKPHSWYMLGQKVHSSRLMTLITRPVPDMLKPAFNFGGISLTQLAEPYVENWLRTRQSVADLINNFSITAIATSMESTLSGMDDGSSIIKRAELFSKTRSNRGLMIIDKNMEEIVQVNTPLGGLHELQAQAQEQMCSVSHIPAIKLTGISPSGLNASSEGEFKAWYDWVSAQQQAHYRDIIDTCIKIIQLSEFGEINPAIRWEFAPIEEMNEKERADIRMIDSQVAGAMIDRGVIDPMEERERLARDKHSGYNGLDLNVDISQGDEDEEEDLAQDADKWITVHPNGKDAKGQPALIGENGEVKGGMGGKFNGKNIKDVHGTKKFTSHETNEETDKSSLNETEERKEDVAAKKEKSNEYSQNSFIHKTRMAGKMGQLDTHFILVKKGTGEAVSGEIENTPRNINTLNAKQLNREKYEAISVSERMQRMDEEIKNGSTAYNTQPTRTKESAQAELDKIKAKREVGTQPNQSAGYSKPMEYDRSKTEKQAVRDVNKMQKPAHLSASEWDRTKDMIAELHSSSDAESFQSGIYAIKGMAEGGGLRKNSAIEALRIMGEDVPESKATQGSNVPAAQPAQIIKPIENQSATRTPQPFDDFIASQKLTPLQKSNAEKLLSSLKHFGDGNRKPVHELISEAHKKGKMKPVFEAALPEKRKDYYDLSEQEQIERLNSGETNEDYQRNRKIYGRDKDQHLVEIGGTAYDLGKTGHNYAKHLYEQAAPKREHTPEHRAAQKAAQSAVNALPQHAIEHHAKERGISAEQAKKDLLLEANQNSAKSAETVAKLSQVEKPQATAPAKPAEQPKTVQSRPAFSTNHPAKEGSTRHPSVAEAHHELSQHLPIVRETDAAVGVENPEYAAAKRTADYDVKELSSRQIEMLREGKSLHWLPKSQISAHEGNVTGIAPWLAKKNDMRTNEGSAAKAQAFEAGKSRYNDLLEQAKAAGVKGVRSMMKTETIKQKMREHGLAVDMAMDDENEGLDYMNGVE